MNLSTKQKQTHRHREQTCGCQRGWMDWEFRISRCKLLYIGWINNKVLLLGTIFYIVINHNGKEYENFLNFLNKFFKNNICVYF